MSKRKKAKKPIRLKFNGKEIKDLPHAILFDVTEQHSEKGYRKNARGCPGWLGFMKNGTLDGKKCVDAEVHRAVLYADFGGKYSYRGRHTSTLNREVVSQDKGGRFEPGEYKVIPPPANEIRRREDPKFGATRGKPRGPDTRDPKNKGIRRKNVKHIRALAVTSSHISR